MKYLIFISILIFSINIAISGTSKDSLSKDVLNVTFVGEYLKNIHEYYNYKVNHGIALGAELEIILSNDIALMVTYQNQIWLENTVTEKMESFVLTDKIEGNNSKYGLMFSYFYHISQKSKIIFATGPTLNLFNGNGFTYRNDILFESGELNYKELGADLFIMLRKRFNKNIHYNFGGRLNINSINNKTINLGVFVSITCKLF